MWDGSDAYDVRLAAAHMYRFLQELVTVHAELGRVSFYLAGESFCGHYLPPLVDLILTNNLKTMELDVARVTREMRENSTGLMGHLVVVGAPSLPYLHEQMLLLDLRAWRATGMHPFGLVHPPRGRSFVGSFPACFALPQLE